jgi:glycosyltransferase involved in cell wall biosynthesis
MAMLFPIQWNEPFGLVMIEAMACGTPAIALPGGSVPEIVRDGVSGYLCDSVDKMAECVRNLKITPSAVRKYAEENFSVEVMTKKYIDLYEGIYGVPHATGELVTIENGIPIALVEAPGAAA